MKNIRNFSKNIFRTLGKNFSAGSSRVHSTCPEEHFAVKVFSSAIRLDW